MAINIPGARLFEEIIAALPTNSRQAIQLREFGEQIEALRKENEALKARLAGMESSPPKLDADALKILKLFFEHSTTLVADTIVDELKMKPGMVQYHFDRLREMKLIRQSTAMAAMISSQQAESF